MDFNDELGRLIEYAIDEGVPEDEIIRELERAVELLQEGENNA